MAKNESDVRKVTRDELVHLMHSQPIILIDVLPHDHFQRVHLPGAINVPLGVLRDLAPLLFGKYATLVVYCANFDCTASPTAAKILMQLGFTDVYDFAGGIQDWWDGGFPVVEEEEQAA